MNVSIAGGMSSESAELAGRVALITGGTSGVGLAAARAFMTAGLPSLICGRSPERAEQAVHGLAAHGEVASDEDSRRR